MTIKIKKKIRTQFLKTDTSEPNQKVHLLRLLSTNVFRVIFKKCEKCTNYEALAIFAQFRTLHISRRCK